MKRLLTWAMVGFMISGSVGSCEAWAQTAGNPTALPPGGANSPGTAGPAGTAQPAGTAGTASPAGGASPAGRAGTSSPATQLSPFNRNINPSLNSQQNPRLSDPSVAPRGFDPSTNRTYFGDGTSARRSFGGNTRVFDGLPESGGSPGAALPGRPNFSGGSTSATLRPTGPIDGLPNPANRNIDPRMRPLVNPFVGNALFPNSINATNFVPLAPVVPVVPLDQEATAAPSDAMAPVARTVNVPPIIINSGAAEASGRNAIQAGTPVTPQQQSPIEQQGIATATAFPTRNPTATGDATVATVTQPAPATRNPNIVEIPTGGGAPRTTDYRGTPSATAQPSGPTFAYPGYTQWQGYYWYHNPAAGWHFWDGQRWVRFASSQIDRS